MARNWSPEARAAHAARMRALNADPAFAAARAEATRTPEARARRAACMRQSWETGALARPDVPAGYEDAYATARRKLGAAEALDLVREVARRRDAVCTAAHQPERSRGKR